MLSRPPPPAPKARAKAHASVDSDAWETAYNAELDRQANAVHYDLASQNKLLRGSREAQGQMLDSRGSYDPQYPLDETHTAAQMPSQTGRPILTSSEAVQREAIQSWDVSGAYMLVPNDPLFPSLKSSRLRADSSFDSPGKSCVICRAMPESWTKMRCWTRSGTYGWRSGAEIYYCPNPPCSRYPRTRGSREWRSKKTTLSSRLPMT